MGNCQHSEVKVLTRGTSSVMDIAFYVCGFECVRCGKRWDIGDAIRAIRKADDIGRLEKVEQAARALCERAWRWWLDDQMCGDAQPPEYGRVRWELVEALSDALGAVGCEEDK